MFMKNYFTPNKKSVPSFYRIFGQSNFVQKYNPKSKEDVVARVHKYNINTITMGFPDLYGRFIGKKYDTDYFVDKALKNGSNACNYLLSCDMGFNPIPNTKMASYERGFGDFTMKADMESLREINYIGDHKQLFFFSDLYDQQTNKPITHAPRYLTKKAVEELKELGFSLDIECEISFTSFFDKYRKLSENFGNAQALTEHSNLYNTFYKMNMDDFLNKMKNSLKISGINIEKVFGFKAPGQFKVSIGTSNPLEFCDNITLLKLCLKKLADESDKTISFMAKIHEDWVGNSLNFKLILKDKDNNNILERTAQFRNSIGENAVAGVLKHLSDFMIFYAPTVNSYKRFKECQIEDNWNRLGFNRDDCAVNIVNEKNVSKLLFTLTGSDVNPYLSLYSLITSIKSGLSNKYYIEESLQTLSKQSLPINLNQSIVEFHKNDYIKTLLGEEMHQHYWAFYNLEYTEFMNQIDEWELNRYLYNI